MTKNYLYKSSRIMKDFYLILFHISIVFSVITASNSFEVLGAVTGTETTIHSSAVLPPPPPAAPTVSLGVSPTGTVCAATALNFTATGSPTTGTNTYEFLVNGSVVQGPGVSNTYSSSSLTNGQQVTTRLTNKPTFDGVINEALWDTPLSTSASGAAPGFGAGHEVNALYSFGTANDFYLAVAGNVQNGNRILVFIDSKSGGYTNGNFGRAGAPQGVDDFNSSTTFDSGFLPDYCLTMGTNGSNYFWDLYTLSGTAGSGGGPNTYLGDNSAPVVAGVDLKASPLNSSQTRGFEAGLPKSLIGYTGGTIKVMVMYTSDAGFLSNQFLTPAGSGEGNYGSGAVTFGAAAPGPIVVSSTALSTVNTATSTPIIASVSLLPTITVSSNSPTCEGSTLSLLATGGSTYSWAGPNSFTSAVQNPSISSVTPAATGTYTVTVTNSAGCSTVGTTAVTINATPTANAGSPQNVCQGGTITLAGSRGGSATTSTWSASSGTFSDATSLTSNYTPSITSGTVTLTLTTNDPDGAGPCSAAVSTVVITVGQAPVVNAGAPQSVCAGQSITLNGSTTGVPATPVTWSAPSGSFSNVNLLTSTYTPSITSGTVTLTLTTSDPDGAGPCVAATSTVLITVMASPTVAAASNTPVCGGNPLSLTSSGGILYSWSGPSGFSSTSQNPSISAVTAANAGDYTVTVTNSNACSATGSTTVVINGAFSASASSNSPVNQGNTINLSTPTSGSSYAWSGPNAFTSSAQNPTVTATPEASGVYTVVVTNASGCTAMATTLVTVNLSQTTVTICSGTDVTLTATISGGSGTCGITWETSPNGTTGWTVIAGETGTTYTTPALDNFTLLQTAVYYRATYTCTGTGCGSSISNTQEILINPEPVGTPLTPAAICSEAVTGVTLNVPLAATYNITNINSNGLTAFAGSPATGTGLAANVLADDAWTNTTGESVNVIYTIVPVSGASPNNCLGNPFTVTVTVNPEPVGVDPAPLTCSDVALNVDLDATTANLSSDTFSWIATDNTNVTGETTTTSTGSFITDNLVNISGTSQTVIYTVTPTSTNGCVGNPFTVTVTVNPEPVGVDPAPLTCSDVALNVDLDATTSNLASDTFSWIATDNADVTGETTTTSTATSITDNLVNISGTSQTVIYTVTPTSSNGCAGNPYTITVTVNPAPIFDVIANAAYCNNDAATAINFNTNVSGATITWTSTVDVGFGTSGNGNIPAYTATNTGTTPVTTTVTVTATGSGCVTTTTFTVTVNPTPTVNTVSTPETCNELNNGTASITPIVGTAPFNYQWNNGDVTANITALSAGTYTATVTDANGCSTITSTTVTQPAPLTATASGVNETCNQLDNATVSVVAAGGTTAYNYVWNSGQTTASASGVSAGTYTVTVTDANGCSVSTSTVVTQPDALTATLESTVNVSCSTITPDGAINIATTGGTTAYTYAWTGTAATTEDLTGLAAGNYTLTVTDANGCSTVVGPITITLNPDPTITVGNSTTICTGGVANFTANVANGVGTCGVQWEQLIGATWTPISGANATTYTTVPLTATTDYRAVYSCSTGCTVTSNPVTATVTADPAISIASNATVCTGGTSVLTATPSGGTDSCIIQWQSSIDNSNWTNIPGANAATYTTPTLTTTTYYRALYTCNGNGCDGATSGSVTITVTATPVIIINATPNGN